MFLVGDFGFILYIKVFNGSCIFEYLASFDRGMLQTPEQLLINPASRPFTNPSSENLEHTGGWCYGPSKFDPKNPEFRCALSESGPGATHANHNKAIRFSCGCFVVLCITQNVFIGVNILDLTFDLIRTKNYMIVIRRLIM